MITISFEETTKCTLQFESQEEFEDWQDMGSVVNDLHDSQIITWKHNIDAFPTD